MKQRLKRTIVCMIAVLAAYGAYAALAVPLLEPTIELSDNRPGRLGPTHPPRERGFEKLFPEDSWELGQPKVLETDRGTLIFDDYERLPDPVGDAGATSHSRLKLTRCSIVFESGEKKRSFVLRAPEGAVLFFEGELNIPRGRFGRLVGGELSGEVTIYSPPTPGQDDGLEIVTRNIRIEERKIWTPHDVSFRYGQNSGAGGDLAIVMHPPAKAKEKGSSQSSVGRIKSFQLVRVDNINLQVPAGKLTVPGAPQQPKPKSREFTPVDIKCRGALKFDFDEHVLSLNDHVDVIRHNADGPSDQLNCQQLQIHFQKATATEADAGMPAMSAKPRKIIAMGLPATLRAESVGGFARGEQLEFDFETNRVWIHDRNGVELRNERYKVASTEIEYEIGPDGRLGLMWAAGPGSVSGLMGKDQRRFEATWQKDVRLQDFKRSKVLSLTDGARVSVENAGEFSAKELHLFLNEQPREDNPKRFTIVPNRMKAVGNVNFDSARLSGTLDEANIWFAPEPTNQSGDRGVSPTPLDSATGKPASASQINKLHVTAQLLNAELQLGDDAQIIQLAARGGVHCENSDRSALEKVLVDCDIFQIEQGNTGTPVATITGQPARVGARGALIVGASIQLQYGANIVEMRGPGEMTLPREKNPQHPWHLAWERQMRFDGQRATFEGNTVARGVQFLRGGEQLHFDARGEVVAATLNKFIAFKDADDQQDVGLDELQFDGECLLRGEVFDQQGVRKSREQMQIHNLSFNQTSGELHGEGPGWLTSVHNGKDLFKEGTFSTTPKGLHYLRVDFQRELVGNLNRRQIEFLGRVRSIYGPVAAWDQTIRPTGSAQLGQRDVVINSERLAVADMGQGRDQFDAVELEATGNAFVRGQTFTASGQRVSYAKAKDQLILEGDGRNDAVLTFQRTPGTKPGTLNAGKILFWPESKHFELDRFRSLELDNLSQFRDADRRR